MAKISFDKIKTEVNVGRVLCDTTGLSSNQYVRKTITKETFEIPFTSVPQVSIGICGFQNTCNPGCHIYFDVSAINITKTDFQIDFSVWGDFKSNYVVVNYTAINNQLIKDTDQNEPSLAISSLSIEEDNEEKEETEQGPLHIPDPIFKKFIGKTVYIKNNLQQLYIREFNGKIELSASAKKMEQWSIEKSLNNNNILFRNKNTNKYMAINNGNNYDGDLISVILDDNQQQEKQNCTKATHEWKLEEIRPYVYLIKNSISNSCLLGHENFDLNFNNCVGNSAIEENEFEIIII